MSHSKGAKQPLLEQVQHSEIYPKDDETEEEALARERIIVTMTNTETGLSTREVEERFAEFGFNELSEKKVNPLIKFLSYFILPMPIMVWTAALIEVIKASLTGDGWPDFVVLMILQFANGTVGFIEEMNAGDAIAALKQRLAPECHVCRNGEFKKMPSRELVPGDLIELKLGDIVPADAMLLAGQPMQVDQSALTGESLPVTIHPGGKVKMGSAIKRGETRAVIVGTGRFTFFGKAADMLNSVEVVGRFQKIVFSITIWLMAISLFLTVIIFIKLMATADTYIVQSDPKFKPPSKFLNSMSVCIVILVASIPIAIEVVCTSTMAVGSRRLAERKVIVARLSAIEELAGMTILCSDKTGTLTQNKLSLNDPVLFGDMSATELVFYAALASKRGGGQDAIDFCICKGVAPEDKGRLDSFREIEFIPFNPTDKRTEATVAAPDGSVFRVTKGAPQVILNMSHNRDEIRARVDKAVQELADRGFRSLGVGISYTGPDQEPKWEFQGVLSVFDPPRVDTKKTIEAAHQNGVEVKMITGDQTAIAVETCRMLGMGTRILNTEALNGNLGGMGATLDEVILNANGFAEVYPEHKFQIVEALRNMGFVTGMTGDGVNDAPALKRADIGIAVEGATDAAKAAADIVLVEPGLSVIIEAIFRSRKIFQRMRNYCIYRIACTLQLIFFFFLAIICLNTNGSQYYGSGYPVNPDDIVNATTTCLPLVKEFNSVCYIDHASTFTLPVISLVVITILNDGTIITIAYDKVIPDVRPQKWDLREVVIISGILAGVACISSVLLLVLSMQARGTDFIARVVSNGKRPVNDWACCKEGVNVIDNYVSWGEMQTMIYLKISLSDFFTVFAARCRWAFWERRPGYALTAALVVATGCSTLFSLVWPFPPDTSKYLNMKPLSHSYAALMVWIYVLLWFVAQDGVKMITYYFILKYQKEDDFEKKLRETKARIAAAIDTDARQARLQGGGGLAREPSILRPQTVTVSQSDVAALQQKLAKLERELAELRALVTAK